jgi:mono/diheme cytochrome c family protein
MKGHPGLGFTLTAAIALGLALPAAAELPAGNVEAGRALFTGARRAQNGGAACGACHAVGGSGPLYAASLGPDLAHSFEGMPVEAVDTVLQDLPFPTMAPLYAGRALTPAERADLAAFLNSVSGKPPPTAGGVAGYAAAIAALCIVGMAFLARRRKGSTRDQLLARTSGTNGGAR